LVSIGWHCFGFSEALLFGLVRLPSQFDFLFPLGNDFATIQFDFLPREISSATSHLENQFSFWLLEGFPKHKIQIFDISDSDILILDISDLDISTFDFSIFDFPILRFSDISNFNFSNSNLSISDF
jgi:hypothetical protein